MYNPFARKKKEKLFTPASGYMSSASTPIPTPRPAPQKTTPPSQSSRPNWYNQAYQNSSRVIQGSGYGKNYAINPSNYTPKPPQPQQSQPQQQAPEVPSYITSYSDLAAKKRQQAEAAKSRKEGYYNQAFAERNKTLSEAIPRLQQQFGDTEGYFKKGMARAGESAKLKKQNVEDEMGAMQRQAAQTRKESSARTAGRFANLNTTDSFGFGSHGRAQENIESDFNRFTQENLKKQQQQKFDIDSQLQEYEISAQQQIDNLKMQLDNTVAQIQSDMRMNDIEKRNALDSVMTDYEAVLSGIDTEMNGVYEKYYQSLSEIGQDSLSKGFMDTGQPETENDIKFMYKNYDAYKDMFKQGGVNEEDLNDKQKLAKTGLDQIAEISKLLSENPDLPQSTKMPFFGQKYDAVRTSLADILGRMRSGGAINEEEFKTFNRLLPSFFDKPDTVTYKLNQLKNEFNNMYGGQYNPKITSQVSNKIRVYGPNGESGTIDESELQEAIQNGWRKV